MSQQNAVSQIAGRRAELMAELFLQELDPVFISRPTSDDVGYDLLVGFLNKMAGVNSFAVEVQSTERPPAKRYQVSRSKLHRVIHSNIPGLLLVADVKHNQMYYAWLTSKNLSGSGETVSVSVIALDEAAKKVLKSEFKAFEGGVAVAG